MKITNERINELKNIESKILHHSIAFQIKEARNKIFQIALQACFQTEKNEVKGKIILGGHVMGDGLGDYYSILKAAKLAKKQYPNASVKIVAEVHPIHKHKIKPSHIENLIYYSDGIESGMPVEIGMELDGASQILQLARPIEAESYPECFKDRIAAILNKTKVIWELACFCDYYSLSNISMGIGLLDAGIFITKMPKEQNLIHLHSQQLGQVFTGKASPASRDFDIYRNKHVTAFAYFTGHFQQKEQYKRIYISTLAHLEKDHAKNLDLIMAAPDPDRLLDRDFIKECGIGNIVQIKQGDVINEWILGEKGKELRLIDPFPLSHHDFKILLLNSHPLAGCTGDQSLCEALSFAKIPFYEVASNIKRGLPSYFASVKDSSPTLHQFFSEVSSLSHPRSFHPSYLASEMHKPEGPVNWAKACREIAIRISELIKKPELQSEWNDVVSYIKKKNDLGLYMQETIQHTAFRILNPEFITLSETLRGKYEREEVELSEAIRELSYKFPQHIE